MGSTPFMLLSVFMSFSLFSKFFFCPSRREHAVPTWLSWHQWLAKGCVLRACFKLIFLFLCFMESSMVHLHVYLAFPSCWESLMSPLHRLAVRQVCTRAYQGLAWLFPGLCFVPPGEPVCCLRRWPYEACWSVVLPYLFTIEVLTTVAMLLLARVLYPLFQSKWGISSSKLWILHAPA